MNRSQHRRSFDGFIVGIVFAAVVMDLTLGYAGLSAYSTAQKEGWDALDIGYKSLQILLMSGPSLKPPIPWMLHTARFLGSAIELSFAFWIVLRLVPDAWQMLLYRFPFGRKRVIVCGSGELAEHLAQQAQCQHKRVLVIDPLCNASQRQILRQQGMVGMEGDPRLPELLNLALLHRSERLIAATESDADNLAIAGAAHKWLAGAKGGQHEVTCHLLIADHALRAELNDHLRRTRHSGRCRTIVGDLNQPLAAARQALADHPLDFLPIREGDTTIAHLIVVGTGQNAQALALHAAQIAHFANEVKGDHRLHLTIATPEESLYQAVLADHPALASVCDLDCLLLPASRAERIASLSGCCRPDELISFAFALDGALNDGNNLSYALSLRAALQKPPQLEQLKAPPQILIHQSTERGPVAYFQQQQPSSSGVALHFFGMVEHCMQWDSLFHERIDQRAEAIHKKYNEKHAAENYPAWGALSEDDRNANRQAAGHISVKLRALGVHVEPLDHRRERVTEFLPQERDLLAQMEHLRWNAGKLLAGWQWGSVSDKPNKINKCICSWDQLPADEKDKDYEQIDLIPQVLHDTGWGIYRLPRKDSYDA